MALIKLGTRKTFEQNLKIAVHWKIKIPIKVYMQMATEASQTQAYPVTKFTYVACL